MLSKKELRECYIDKRNTLTADEISLKSALITKQLLELEPYKNSKSILFYVSARSEVYTHELIQSAISIGKQVHVPITDPKSLTMDASRLLDFEDELRIRNYNILEPIEEFTRICPPDQIDLILVPGLAFDRQGFRLGYGAGYYDKFLSKVHADAIKIGLAYDFQLCDNLPHEEHDIPCDYIVTQTGVVTVEQR